MVLTRTARSLGLLSVLWLGAAGLSAALQSVRPPEDVRAIVDRSCGVPGCHQGPSPAAGLDLSSDRFPATVIDVPSREVPGRLLVDASKPQASYLLAKVRGAEDIVGARMPIGGPPLEPEEIRALERWMAGLSGSAVETAGVAAASMFQGTRLVNLPTTNVPARREVLFLVAHRFLPAASTGYDTFYGLDGPASVYLSLEYGVSERVSVAVGRANLDQELEAAVDWLLRAPQPGQGVPLSLKLRAGGAWVTAGGSDLSGGDRFGAFAQLCAAWRLSDRLTLEAVPSFASRTNDPAAPARRVWALGLGGRWLLGRGYALVGDWVPALDGLVNPYSAWGAGLEKRLGGHVFQAFATNAIGISVPRYLAGGDLRLGDGDFRLGFHIFRSF